MENKWVNFSDEELAVTAKSDPRALEALMARYAPLIKKISRSYQLIGGDVEDLIQEGNMGLCSAVSGYDGEKPFKAFACVCIRRSVLSAVVSDRRIKNRALNEATINRDSDESFGGGYDAELFFSDETFSPEVLFDEREKKKETEKRIEKVLSPLEYRIMQEYVNGYSYTEIGEKLQKSQKSIDNAVQRIRKKLEKEFQ